MTRHSQAEVLDSLGELATQTSATHQARDHHNKALAIASKIGTPLQEARAREGLGRAYLQDSDSGEAAAHLQQALSVYRRIETHPAARRVQQTLHQHGLTASTAEPRSLRAVITMLCTWGCGRPCGPRWCSKEAATQRWGLAGENLLRPASCRNLSAA